MMMLENALNTCPLAAILRGITPDEVLAVAEGLYEAGFRLIEVPLNSPDPFDSIRRLNDALGDRCLVGAGTLISVEQLDDFLKTGARLMIAPNVNVKLIKKAKAAGLTVIPGFTTPSEAYAAIEAGADALKIFPCNLVGPATLKAMKTILPQHMPLLGVGGIDLSNMSDFLKAGATGFGLGSALYRPGDSADAVKEKGLAFIAALKNQ